MPAIATCALVAAVLAYRLQNRQLRSQQRQITEQQDLNRRQSEVLELQAQELRESISDRRRSHVSQVSLELAHAPQPDGSHTWSATVLNAGTLPIHEPAIRFRHGDREWNPGAHLEHTHNGFGPDGRLSPGAHSIWNARLLPKSGVDPDTISAWVEFRDANEIWWRIKPDGRIQEIEPPERH